MKKIFILLLYLLVPGLTALAQVTIGADKAPEKFSALEIISNQQAGLRMPLMTTEERDDMTATQKFQDNKDGLAKGLTIFNTTIDCLEFWNGEKWISTCEGDMPPYIPATPNANATVTACAVSSVTASVLANTGFYMFTYQTMNMYANYSGGTPASYQWVVDGKLVAGANGATYAYTPPADITLEEDELGNYKKYVNIICQMKVGDNEVQPVNDFRILVVQATKGTLSPVYVWGHEGGVAGATKVKMAFAHVNLGAENDTDPCNCLGDLYQWGRVADGHQVRTSASYPTNDTSTENGIAAIGDLDATGQIAEGNPREGKFIKQNASPYSWRPVSGMTGLWGDNTIGTSANYNQDKGTGDPCPTGWKVPSQKQWSAIYQGGTTSGAPGASTSGSTWTNQGRFTTGSTSGYKVADALYLPAGGFRYNSNASLNSVGSSGCYWSSTVYSSNDSYYLYFYSGYVNPGNTNYYRAYGHSVRCVAE